MYRVVVSREGSEERHELDLDRDVALVGRRAGVDVPLPDPAVGGVHLRLERAGDVVVLVDAGAGPTEVGGARVPPGGRRPLADGDEIVVAGVFRLRYVARSPAAQATGAAGTAALARAMVRDLLASLGQAAPEQAPALEVTAGPARGRRIELPAPGRDLVIGRGESCDAVIVDADLSREHARVHRDFSGATIADLGSKNGTRVAGARLATGEERRLAHGDEIVLGGTTLRFVDPTERYLAQLSEPPDPASASAPAPAPPPAPAPAPAEPEPEKPKDSVKKLKNSRPSLFLAVVIALAAAGLLVLLLSQ